MIRTVDDLAHALARGLALEAGEVIPGTVLRIAFGAAIPEQAVIPVTTLEGGAFTVTVARAPVTVATPKDEEPAVEDIRNALQLVRTLPGGLAYQALDLESIDRLLQGAIDKLDPSNPPPETI